MRSYSMPPISSVGIPNGTYTPLCSQASPHAGYAVSTLGITGCSYSLRGHTTAAPSASLLVPQRPVDVVASVAIPGSAWRAASHSAQPQASLSRHSSPERLRPLLAGSTANVAAAGNTMASRVASPAPHSAKDSPSARLGITTPTRGLGVASRLAPPQVAAHLQRPSQVGAAIAGSLTPVAPAFEVGSARRSLSSSSSWDGLKVGLVQSYQSTSSTGALVSGYGCLQSCSSTAAVTPRRHIGRMHVSGACATIGPSTTLDDGATSAAARSCNSAPQGVGSTFGPLGAAVAANSAKENQLRQQLHTIKWALDSWPSGLTQKAVREASVAATSASRRSSDTQCDDWGIQEMQHFVRRIIAAHGADHALCPLDSDSPWWRTLMAQSIGENGVSCCAERLAKLALEHIHADLERRIAAVVAPAPAAFGGIGASTGVVRRFSAPMPALQFRTPRGPSESKGASQQQLHQQQRPLRDAVQRMQSGSAEDEASLAVDGPSLYAGFPLVSAGTAPCLEPKIAPAAVPTATLPSVSAISSGCLPGSQQGRCVRPASQIPAATGGSAAACNIMDCPSLYRGSFNTSSDPSAVHSASGLPARVPPHLPLQSLRPTSYLPAASALAPSAAGVGAAAPSSATASPASGRTRPPAMGDETPPPLTNRTDPSASASSTFGLANGCSTAADENPQLAHSLASSAPCGTPAGIVFTAPGLHGRREVSAGSSAPGGCPQQQLGKGGGDEAFLRLRKDFDAERVERHALSSRVDALLHGRQQQQQRQHETLMQQRQHQQQLAARQECPTSSLCRCKDDGGDKPFAAHETEHDQEVELNMSIDTTLQGEEDEEEGHLPDASAFIAQPQGIGAGGVLEATAGSDVGLGTGMGESPVLRRSTQRLGSSSSAETGLLPSPIPLDPSPCAASAALAASAAALMPSAQELFGNMPPIPFIGGRKSAPSMVGSVRGSGGAVGPTPVSSMGPGTFLIGACGSVNSEGSSEPQLAALMAEPDAAIEAELEKDLVSATTAMFAADTSSISQLAAGSGAGRLPPSPHRLARESSALRPGGDAATAGLLDDPAALVGLEAHAPKVLSFYRRKCLELASQVHRRDTEVVKLRQALNEARAAKAMATADGNSAGTGELTADPALVHASVPSLVQAQALPSCFEDG
mmetsp:Transcript_59562/g.150933  ORF Transcript_59562/g.150933 Transcript_59562/m.150933 type:complete len:1152 (+) Transcript_59562:153-3608(+)